jgi:hypothetical protein
MIHTDMEHTKKNRYNQRKEKILERMGRSEIPLRYQMPVSECTAGLFSFGKIYGHNIKRQTFQNLRA